MSDLEGVILKITLDNTYREIYIQLNQFYTTINRKQKQTRNKKLEIFRDRKNLSENIFNEVLCPKFYPLIFYTQHYNNLTFGTLL